MKIRSDFVTNSSSSSFVCFKIKSKELADVFKKYESILRYFIGDFCVDSDVIDLKSDYNLDDMFPSSNEKVYGVLLDSFEGFRGCTMYDKNGDYDYDKVKECDRFFAEFEDKEDEIKKSIERVYWEREQELYGGSGYDRYDRTVYSSDALRDILEEVSKINKCSIREVTEKMFNDYVLDKSLMKREVLEDGVYSYRCFLEGEK